MSLNVGKIQTQRGRLRELITLLKFGPRWSGVIDDNDKRDLIARSIASISMQCHEITLVFKMNIKSL